MKDCTSHLIAAFAVVLGFVSFGAHAARSTPVTVVNDSASPVPVEAKSYRYVGNSMATTLPNIGINGMHKTCQADFGAAARMCTTEEAFKTPKLPSSPGSSTRAWVSPVITTAFSTGTFTRYIDSTGVSFADGSPSPAVTGMSCLSYSSNESLVHGAVVRQLSIGLIVFTTLDCSTSAFVACCLPQ